MAGKSAGRPPGTGYAIDYNKVRALARFQALQKEIAQEIGISEEKFCVRLKTDKQLYEAYHGGKNLGKLGARKIIYDAMLDHYFTFCQNPACSHIFDDGYKFFPQCPDCDGEGVDDNGDPKRYGVKHRREPGDSRIREKFATTYLDWTDRQVLEGNADKPIAFTSLADFSIHMAKINDEKKAKAKAKLKAAES